MSTEPKEQETDETKMKPPAAPFEEFTWKGQKRYRCNRHWEGGAPCNFDTYSLDLMKRHSAEPHSFTGKTDKIVNNPPPKGPEPQTQPRPEHKDVKFAEEKK